MSPNGRRAQRAVQPVREWFGYVGTWLVATALGALPERLGLALAAGLAHVAMRVDWIHRPLARRNLDQAYGDALSAAEKDRIVLGSYRNMLQNAVEFAHAVRRARRGERPAEIEVVGFEHVERILNSGRGALFVSCHMGNWELCPVGTLQHGARLHSIAMPRRNAGVDRLLTRMRESLGQTIVEKRGAFGDAAQLLRAGRFIGVLADQNQRKSSVFVDFFGMRASTTRGPALLARRAGVPILPAAIRRLPGRNRHQITVTEPIEPIRSDAPDEDVLRMTEAYTARLESLIREVPEQWLWHHRRWRTRPWLEIRTERDRSTLIRSFATSAHGIGMSLEPPTRPWEPMPAPVRLGWPTPVAVLRRCAPAVASAGLQQELARLRGRRDPAHPTAPRRDGPAGLRVSSGGVPPPPA